METIYCEEIPGYLDRKHLEESLKDALRDVHASVDCVVISIGPIEINIDYENNELFITQ